MVYWIIPSPGLVKPPSGSPLILITTHFPVWVLRLLQHTHTHTQRKFVREKCVCVCVIVVFVFVGVFLRGVGSAGQYSRQGSFSPHLYIHHSRTGTLVLGDFVF
jgi:hypothetical protein